MTRALHISIQSLQKPTKSSATDFCFYAKRNRISRVNALRQPALAHIYLPLSLISLHRKWYSIFTEYTATNCI